MKKCMYVAVLVAVLGFTACGSDDDSMDICKSCANGPISIELCDKGNGTYSINGEPPIDIPEGSTFDEIFMVSCETIGAP